MINLTSVRQEFEDRMDTIDRILNATHGSSVVGIERESRGVAILLMFAAYERLLHELSTSLVSVAVSLGVGNRRLRPGFRALALHGAATSLRDASHTKMYSKTLINLVQLADQGRGTTLIPSMFPDDGSYMKKTQIQVWCSIFEIFAPQKHLKNIWSNIDGVVSDRNAIAHGKSRPEEVGRKRSQKDVFDLSKNWREDWLDFIAHVEARGSSRDFYRKPR